MAKAQDPRMSESKLVRAYKPADKTVQGICATEPRDLCREDQVRMASLQRSKQDSVRSVNAVHHAVLTD